MTTPIHLFACQMIWKKRVMFHLVLGCHPAIAVRASVTTERLGANEKWIKPNQLSNMIAIFFSTIRKLRDNKFTAWFRWVVGRFIWILHHMDFARETKLSFRRNRKCFNTDYFKTVFVPISDQCHHVMFRVESHKKSKKMHWKKKTLNFFLPSLIWLHSIYILHNFSRKIVRFRLWDPSTRTSTKTCNLHRHQIHLDVLCRVIV